MTDRGTTKARVPGGMRAFVKPWAQAGRWTLPALRHEVHTFTRMGVPLTIARIRWNPNIQRIRAIVNGTRKRVNVCTSCLKAGKVQRPA